MRFSSLVIHNCVVTTPFHHVYAGEGPIVPAHVHGYTGHVRMEDRASGGSELVDYFLYKASEGSVEASKDAVESYEAVHVAAVPRHPLHGRRGDQVIDLVSRVAHGGVRDGLTVAWRGKLLHNVVQLLSRNVDASGGGRAEEYFIVHRNALSVVAVSDYFGPGAGGGRQEEAFPLIDRVRTRRFVRKENCMIVI